ncbi:MAG: FHA domain-containing protein [Erysipelotrichaceae bacterium]|nr:FHA domain-containing protein [Erysipelotrichaceae bacterium]
MKDCIHHLQVRDQKLELYMHTPQDIHEYQLLLIQKETCCLCLERSLKKKELLICDVSAYCSLLEYLKYVKFQEQQFIFLCTQLLETMKVLMNDKAMYLDIRYIFIENTTGVLKFLCIPIVNYSYEGKELHHFLYGLVKEVQVDKAYILLGVLVQALKKPEISLTDLLKEIYEHIKRQKSFPLFHKYSKRKKDVSFNLPYPIQFLSYEKDKKYAYLKNEKQSIYLTHEEGVLGRSSTCDYVLEDTHISKQHACIIWKNYQYYVKDLYSKNGTWLNSMRLDSTKIYRLLHKDILRFASYSFTFYDE